jgi:hypothetical protein
MLAALTQPASAAVKPLVDISGPLNGHVYQPSEKLDVFGTANANLTVVAIKLEYWLANKLVRRVLAECRDCGSFATGWKDSPNDLTPGYYVVKAYSYDQAGNQSDPAQRSFVTGLERVPPAPTVTPPPAPTTPGVPATPIVTVPQPGSVIPGAGPPTTIGGTGDPGDTIGVSDPNKGKLATVEAGPDGKWTATLRLPNGQYKVRAQATDDNGKRSKLSKLISFYVDAQKPSVQILNQDTKTFFPTQPVVLSGKLFDNHHIAAVTLKYYLLDKVAAQSVADCIACSAQEGVWQDRPDLPYPGYYYVQIQGFDTAGNASVLQTTSFVYTI